MLGSRIRFLVARFLFIAVPGFSCRLMVGIGVGGDGKFRLCGFQLGYSEPEAFFKELHKLLDDVLLFL